MSREFKLLPLRIGCDPEIFLRDKVTKKFVSAHGLLPGTKREPFAVERGTLQVDGMAAEIGIIPAEGSSNFRGRVCTVLEKLKEAVPNHDLVFDPICEFDEDVWATTPEEAKQLGCDPDYDAYTGEQNVMPEGAEGRRFRTASGHIHIGWTEDMDINDPDHIEACRTMARQMDYLVGFPSLFCDADNRRRKLYGKAGAIRIKPYGVEYRTPSNFWLKHTGLMEWIHQSSVRAYNLLMDGVDIHEKMGNLARDTINHDGQITKDMLMDVYNKIRYTVTTPLLPGSDKWAPEISGVKAKAKTVKNPYEVYGLSQGRVWEVVGGRG